MPYAKTKDGSLVNEVTLGDGYPLSNDLKPLKIGGEASILEISSPLPDGSDNGKVKVRGDLEVTGGLNFKNDVEVDLSFDDLSLSGDLDVAGSVGIGTTSPNSNLHIKSSTGSEPVIQLETALDGGGADTFIRFGDSTENYSYALGIDDSSNTFRLAYNGSSYNGAVLGTTDLITVSTAGNIGIGISAPTTTLDVDGTVSYKHTAFTTAGPTDDLDVSGTTVLEVDTSSNNVTIGGLAGGVQGQVLYVVKTNTTNFLQMEHNESGSTQAIFLTSGADERTVGYGGYTLYCNGTSWFSLSNPTGAADSG